MRSIVPILMLLLMVIPVLAQADPAPESTPDTLPQPAVLLAAEHDAMFALEYSQVVQQTDLFGQNVLAVLGVLHNISDDTAYRSISLFADVTDADKTLIGEGFGSVTDVCGIGLLPDFALQPGDSQRFRLQLELFETDAIIDQVEIFVQASTSDAAPAVQADFPGVTRISAQEVVSVEWLDANSLRFGVGCFEDVFTMWDWFALDLPDEPQPAVHPAAERVTPLVRSLTSLEDPEAYRRSFLTFPPNARRGIYQTELNAVYTTEPDGSFRRLIFDNLWRFSLQGFIWQPNGVFLAYYYGAAGDEVRYFTATLDGQRISVSVYDVIRSFTVPGPTPDGTNAIITATINDVTGYYLVSTRTGDNQLLFEADPPGNNWPAPVYVPRERPGAASIYIIRPVDDVPSLECMDLESGERRVLTPLPLDLTSEARARTWHAPDGETIALAATGVSGGLWLIDLTTLDACPGAEA